LFEEGELHGSFWPAYLVLGLAFLFDGAVLVIAVREVRHQADLAQQQVRDYLRTTSDVTLKTALYEDIAATAGVVIAALGLALLQLTGNAVFDGIASILIGVVLIGVAIMLGMETRRLLLGASAEPRHRQAIRDTITGFPQVQSVVVLLTMQLGLNSILVTGEINIRDGLTTDEIEDLMVRIEQRIRAAVPAVKNIFLEPHGVRDGNTPRSSAAAGRS
jgi:divalent metal cation (Fe/Co/Zn/Cd) transporter